MATASAGAASAEAAEDGYDEDWVGGILDQHKCAICHFVLRNPVQETGCGHRFCKYCWDNLCSYNEQNGRQTTCPLGREVIEHVFPDKGMKRDVESLKVYCKLKSAGCTWTGELRDAKNHNEKCEFNLLPCKFHFEGCNQKIKKTEYNEHLKTCEYRCVDCGFKEFGCTHKVRVAQQDDPHKHLDLVQSRVTAFKVQCREYKSQISTLEARVRYLERQQEESVQDMLDRPDPERAYYWCIKLASQKVQAAERGQPQVSPPFYTCHPGYCFKLKMRQGKAGNLSFELVLIKGMHDDELDWPFRRKMAVHVISHVKEHKKVAVNFNKANLDYGVAQEEARYQTAHVENVLQKFEIKKFIKNDEMIVKCFLA